MIHPKRDPKATTAILSRRRCLGLLAASALPATTLPGCALVSTESPYWATVAAVTGVTQPVPVTRQQADDLPYASILAWYDDGAVAFMVLGEVGPQRELVYYSQSRQVLVTRGPFIVRSVGMAGDLTRTIFPTDWPMADNGEPADLRALAGRTLVRRIDIQSAALFDVPLSSRFTLEGTVQIKILGRSLETVILREDVQMPGEKPYTNRYWLDAKTGFCWKSNQHIHARADAMNIEVTKPAG
ncbi:YjbF family lipoprotein [Niveispirillum sp. BGYR6]|uniref:YjbF family lipoprotein n=1 Tax=Niveispirillum sp. BGYR6 TaxID=2971249 RepID=UPI0022B9C36E|nr:YjbF family lipoprotein [Niveispirillum sp. BGYR6]MDG5496509.1 YjbF family lipoprotein [Niveispirillum sp. BGYR6]